MTAQQAKAWVARPSAECTMVIYGDGARMHRSCAPWPSLPDMERAAASCGVPVHGYSWLVQVLPVLLACLFVITAGHER